ncbi:hypothetical protein L4C44_03260 [Vibrio satsumensis]|uniref:hypothetical protein n=1 Tax=Vibrio satsumensis TaxID=2910245 RepID=UPI003D0CB538
MDWKTAELINAEERDSNHFANPEYVIPAEWIQVHYYEAANILFRFENSFRVFVYSILKMQFGKDWANTKVNENQTLNQVYKARSALDNKHGYLGQSVSSPMLYLNSGELTYIIDSETLWTHFKPYFKADRSVIVNKLHEINSIRNSFAHFRPVSENDLTLLKLNISHIFYSAVDYFENLYNQFTEVPSNLNEKWYQELKAHNTENTTLTFNRSKNDKWVTLRLTLSLPLLNTIVATRSHHNIRTMQLRLDRLLKQFKDLVSITTFITDGRYVLKAKPPSFPINQKSLSHSVNFTFSRSTINRESELIVGKIKQIIETLESDIEIIRQDTRAEGGLLAPLSFFVHDIDGDISVKAFHSSYNNIADDAGVVEYWGKTVGTFMDPVSDISNIPWIKGLISNCNTSF